MKVDNDYAVAVQPVQRGGCKYLVFTDSKGQFVSFSLQSPETKSLEVKKGGNFSLKNLNRIIVRFINMQGFHVQFIGPDQKVICKALLTMKREALKKLGAKKAFERTFRLKDGEKFTCFKFDS
jgi:hypothetical protein